MPAMGFIRMTPRFVAITLLTAALAMVASEADAKRSRGKKYRAKPAQQNHYVQPASAEKRDNNTLCDGGVLITADDQIKGCTALITSGRLNRERKATALYNRGNAQFAKSDLARAIEDYTQALSYRSDYVQALFNRAVAHRMSGDMQLAAGDYSSVIALTPSDADAFAGRGTAYARLQQYDKAVADFDRAIALAPGNLAARTQRAHHHVRMQQWPVALADYGAALSVQPTNAEALYGRGVAKVYTSDVKGGQTDMAHAIALDSGVAARMTTQGIPPPQITENLPAIARPSKPKDETQAAESKEPPPPDGGRGSESDAPGR